MRKKILVIDVGGSNVKLHISPRVKRRKFPSGPDFRPRQLVAETKKLVGDWKYDAIAIGFPAPVVAGKIKAEPKNLGSGWVRFDFAKAFGKPVRIMNDAAMQALGSYRGGRMLFLGLGTGLGSALVWNKNVLSLELSDAPYIDNQTVEDLLGDTGLERVGVKNWEREIERVVAGFKQAFLADYVVLGGGNAKRVQHLPDGAQLGHNRNALPGGQRLWQSDARTHRPTWNII
jgi:polyphosphate glucokinase